MQTAYPKAALILSATALLSVLTFPVAALECANSGTAPATSPDDTGDGTATACGDGAIADGVSSTALGFDASSVGVQSTALGFNANSGGTASVALGNNAAAAGDGSVALGQGASSGGDRSSALGYRASAPNPDTIVLGQIPGVGFGSSYVSVANGTTDPLAPLHIFRDDATREMLFLESDQAGEPQDRAMMFLANNGGIRFEFANNALATSWRFQAATGNQDRFEVTRVGTGQIEFWIDDLGNGFIAGDLDVGGNLLTNVLLPSDRDLKTRIEAIDPATVLDKVASLPMNAWEYRDQPGVRHIGPMAQDFQAAFGLGRDDTSISVVDASGVALASIQALEQRNAELEAGNADLQQQLGVMREELDQVKALVMQLLPQTARH